MANPFDQKLGYYELGGIGSKLKKAVKKITKPIKKLESAARAIEKKIVPKKLLEVQKKVRNNKVVQGAAIAVASVYAGPLVGMALKGGAGQAITGKAVLTAAAKGAAKAGLKQGLTKLVNKKMSAKQQDELNKATAQAANEINQLRQSPEFEKVYTDMKAKGASDADVVQTWVNSDTYKTIASQNAAATIKPRIEATYVAAGATPSQAEFMAARDAQVIGTEAADSVGGLSLGKIALIGIPVLFALMGA